MSYLLCLLFLSAVSVSVSSMHFVFFSKRPRKCHCQSTDQPEGRQVRCIGNESFVRYSYRELWCCIWWKVRSATFFYIVYVFTCLHCVHEFILCWMCVHLVYVSICLMFILCSCVYNNNNNNYNSTNLVWWHHHRVAPYKLKSTST